MCVGMETIVIKMDSSINKTKKNNKIIKKKC